MGSPSHEVEQLCQCLKLFPCARPRQIKSEPKSERPWLLLGGHGLANHSQGRSCRIQMGRRRWRKPILQVSNELPFLGRLLDLREAGQIGISRQFRRQGTFVPQEKKSQFLQPRLALSRQEPWPPIETRKILTGQGKFLEIILEQKPGPLGIATA